jgi:hypothetical protein
LIETRGKLMNAISANLIVSRDRPQNGTSETRTASRRPTDSLKSDSNDRSLIERRRRRRMQKKQIIDRAQHLLDRDRQLDRI